MLRKANFRGELNGEMPRRKGAELSPVSKYQKMVYSRFMELEEYA